MREDSVQKRVKEMLTLRDEISPVDVKERHIKLSYDNRKTTALVPSVSLIPVADCGNCELCARGCYDVRHVCMYKQTKAQRANNSALLKYDRLRYFEEIAMHAHFLRFFRWHVGGDIKDMDYLERMVKVAKEVPGCEFLVFTKMFRIVERYLKENGEFPENFHLILSGWKGDKTTNPYRLPVSTPVWPDGEKSGMATEKEIWCGGNCADCAACHGGCWGAQKGDTVLFKAH